MTSDGFDRWLRQPDHPLVMGILNVTPDSFSDGGKFLGADAAVAHAEAMVNAGVDWIDVGGETTRPGSLPVEPQVQIERTASVIEAISKRLPVVLSIDTTRATVAEAAIQAGAHVVNDVAAGLQDPDLLPLVARRNVAVILMHMQGTPQTMQLNPTYTDVVAEVKAFLAERTKAAIDAGVAASKILLDPGIGFGKTVDHNLSLLRHLDQFMSSGRPLVVGTSRKGFIGKITGETDPAKRVYGTAGTVAWAVANGAAVVRVHDVEPMVQVVRIVQAIRQAS